MERRSSGDQVERLEDEADLLVPDHRQLVVIELADIGAVEEVAACRRHVQATDDVHESGLARAAGAHDGDELAFADMHVDTAQRLDVDLAHPIGLGDPLERDHPPIRTPPPGLPLEPPVLVGTLRLGITIWSPSLRPPETSVNWSPTTPVWICVWIVCPFE